MNADERIKVANDNSSKPQALSGHSFVKKRAAGGHRRASFHELASPTLLSQQNRSQKQISNFSVVDSINTENSYKSETFRTCFKFIALSGLLISLFALVFAFYAFSPLILGSAFSVVVFSTLILCLTDQNWRVQEMTALTLWLTLSLIGLLAFQTLGTSVFLAGSAGFSIAYLSKTRLPAISGALSVLIFVGSGI